MVQGKDKERTNLVDFYPQIVVKVRTLREKTAFKNSNVKPIVFECPQITS